MATESEELAGNAVVIGYDYTRLTWQKGEDFARARESLLSVLADVSITDLEIPSDYEAFRAEQKVVSEKIIERLDTEQAKFGERRAVPLFQLVVMSAAAAGVIAFRMPGRSEPFREVLQILDELKLPRELGQVLEREASWIELDDGKLSFRMWFGVVRSFALRVLDELDAPESSARIYEGVLQIQAQLSDFQQEFRETARGLEQLIREGNAEIARLTRQVEATLVDEGGLTPVEARKITQDPVSFSDRVVRWLRGKEARDAAEAALWAALDFVPGGTGVKLGVKIAAAVRKATAR